MAEEKSVTNLTDHLSPAAQFGANGYLFLPGFCSPSWAVKLREMLQEILLGRYESGLAPDKIKWRPPDGDSVLKSVCNAWKSDPRLLQMLLEMKVGEVVKRLTGWSGVKLNQDSLIVVPPGVGGSALHQDNPYQDWHSPGEVVTIWLALTEIRPNGSTLEVVKGSNHWANAQRLSGSFIGRHSGQWGDDFLNALTAEGIDVEDLDLVTLHYKVGDASIHHGKVWHGSSTNETEIERWAYALHCMPSHSTFTDFPNPVFSKYRIGESKEMHTCFFPDLA